MFTALPSIRDTLQQWARKTTSSFFEFSLLAGEEHDEQPDADGLIYRLKRWPDLPPAQKTAPVLRTLSVMSHRPVNRRWILATTKMHERQVDSLLQWLVDHGAVEVIDGARFSSALPA